MIHTQHNKKQHTKNKFRALEREDRQRVYSERLLSHANARKLNQYNRLENDTLYGELVHHVADTNYASMKNYICNHRACLTEYSVRAEN